MNKYLMIGVTILISTAPSIVKSQEKEFTMDGELGVIVTTGNTDTTSISAGLSARHELENWSNEYLINGLYTRDSVDDGSGGEEDVTTAQKFFTSAQGNYKLTNPNYRIFAFGSYEDDRFSNFKFQGTVAGGWNHKVWDNQTSEFEYSVGPGYSFSETQEGESVDGAILRAALAYIWNISDTAKFTQSFATEIGSDNTKSRAESALSAKIYENLSLKVSLKLDHNTDVNPGVDKLDTETAVTLVYSFF